MLTSTRGSLLVKPPEPIYLHRDGFYVGRIEGAVLTADQVADEKDRAILRAVRGGAQSANTVAATVKGNRPAALARVGDLERRGLLQRGTGSGTGKLMVSPAGSKFLEAAE